MDTIHMLKRGIVGLTAAVLVSGGVGLAGLGLAGPEQRASAEGVLDRGTLSTEPPVGERC
jgi:hypothetical protein